MLLPRRLRFAPLLAILLSAPVLAHDTWFHHEPADAAGRRTLALGTGNQFPVQETAIGPGYLQQAACRPGDGATLPLTPLHHHDTALLLQLPPAAGRLSCWAQVQPFEIELAPDKVRLYLKEINASPEVHAAWAGLQARGVPWKERYAKHARIELPGPGGTPAVASGMAMDVLPLGDVAAWRSGDTVAFQVLRDGQPLAGLAVELRNERSALGLWQRTDAQGQVRLRLPLPGRWVLRGTELRSSAARPDTWESRFVTLAFELGAQNGSSSSSNARSTNHTAASTAISSEPPNSTQR